MIEQGIIISDSVHLLQFSVSLERYKLCKSRCRTTLAQAYHSFLLVIILEKSSHSWMSSVSGLSTYRCTSAY